MPRALLILLAGSCCVACAGQTPAPGSAIDPLPSSLEPGMIEAGGVRLPYRLFNPKPSGDPLPLVVFLHGRGERGTDNHRQLSVHRGPLVFISSEAQKQHPCFFVAPQLPEPMTRWGQAEDALLALIRELVDRPAIDDSRIYLTGLSMGGEGVLALASRHPDMFAALVPMSAWSEAPLDAIAQTPIWMFHGARDEVVPPEEARAIVSARDPALTRYTEYPDGAHVIWETAFATPDLVDWLMSQRRPRAP